MDVRQSQTDKHNVIKLDTSSKTERKERQRLGLHDLNLDVSKVILQQFDILIYFYSTGNNRKANRFMHEL